MPETCLHTTRAAVRAILKTDPLISVEQRAEIMDFIQRPWDRPPITSDEDGNLIVTYDEAERLTGTSRKTIMRMASKGHIRKACRAGSSRACGVYKSEIDKIGRVKK